MAFPYLVSFTNPTKIIFRLLQMNKKPAKPALRSVFPDLQFSPDPDAAEKDVFEFESPPSKSPTVSVSNERRCFTLSLFFGFKFVKIRKCVFCFLQCSILN